MAVTQYSRTELVIGQKAIDCLRGSRVAVFGVGGVGGSVVEALARCGIGTLDLVDNDTVNVTNINRQMVATYETIGQLKVDAAEEKVHAINPDIIVNKYPVFYLPETRDQFDFSKWDYIVDAIDTVTAKLDIIEQAQKYNVPIISCMGCGNRVDPTKLTVTDLYQTKNDPLARIMRYECRKRKIKKLKVVYSTETPIKPLINDENRDPSKRHMPGSTSFVPPAAGMIAASQVMLDLTQFDPAKRV